MTSDNQSCRTAAMADAKHIIIKVGTRLLNNEESIGKIICSIAKLRESGRRVLLVTSGAVGLGMKALGLTKRPKELARKQALAAIGQTELMSAYSREASKNGFLVAQLLLTASDLRNRGRYLNVINCINDLWSNDILPIVNENDSVSVDELKFGDNDTLAGMLTAVTGAEIAVILTTVDGLLDRNPDGTLGERISIVKELTPELWQLAGGTDDSDSSVGGMTSKLRAAELVTSAGSSLWIASGSVPGIMDAILNGDDVGTLFLPKKHTLSSRKCWLGFFSEITGRLYIDAGAEKALLQHGKSLLPSGLVSISGEFQRGDTVEVYNEKRHLIAKGLINFSAADCLKITGKHTGDIYALFGNNCDPEVIHRNNMILTEI